MRGLDPHIHHSLGILPTEMHHRVVQRGLCRRVVSDDASILSDQKGVGFEVIERFREFRFSSLLLTGLQVADWRSTIEFSERLHLR
jgi:hypothetical protein